MRVNLATPAWVLPDALFALLTWPTGDNPAMEVDLRDPRGPVVGPSFISETALRRDRATDHAPVTTIRPHLEVAPTTMKSPRRRA